MQFDQDFGQLIGWLNEKSQQAILSFQSHDFNHDASRLKEGFEPAKSWLHLIAVCFAFVSDVLKPLAPRFTKGLAIGGFTLSVPPFLGVESGFVPEGLAPLASALIVFCLSVAVLSSVVLFLQRGHEHGALAELVPGVERLQERLGIIETKIDKVKEDTEALRKAHEEEKARSEERHKEATEGQKRLGRLVMDAAGGGASAVQAVAGMRDLLRPGIPEIDTISPEQLPSLVKRIFEDLQKPAARPEDFSGTVKRVLEEAQAQAAELKFADAAQVLDAALAATEVEERGRARGRAALLAERGRIARLQLRYREAADFYARAAEAVTFDPAATWGYTLDTAGALYAQGDEFGDNPALSDAIRACRSASDIATRARVPLDWAATQTNLGNALFKLGERESGTGKLMEAVAAYREALKERTRDRVPLQWAVTQTNLGSALARLGERESGTEKLEGAVAAYRAALEEYTRDRVPLDWAATQMNLGNALMTLGLRESGTEKLEEAVAAYRAALEERTRERVPLDWAMTQTNLGNALETLGERESGTGKLEEAVAALRAALEEYTRARVPLHWAATQMNLGNALENLGWRESGTARLEEAVAAWNGCLAVTSSVWPPKLVRLLQTRQYVMQAEIALRSAK